MDITFAGRMENQLADTHIQPGEAIFKQTGLNQVKPECEILSYPAGNEKIKARWTPDHLNSNQPEYKPVKASFSKTSIPAELQTGDEASRMDCEKHP